MNSFSIVHATEALVQEFEYMVAYENGTLENLPLGRYDYLEPYKTTLFKSSNWAYEREWRLTLSGVFKNKRINPLLPSENITRVILGPKTTVEDQAEIGKALREYAKWVKRPIPLQQITVDWQSDAYEFCLKNCGRVPCQVWEQG